MNRGKAELKLWIRCRSNSIQKTFIVFVEIDRRKLVLKKYVCRLKYAVMFKIITNLIYNYFQSKKEVIMQCICDCLGIL